MTYRRYPDTIREILRDIEDRLRRLEHEDRSVRRNSIRIGNLVLEADPRPPAAATSLKITNLDSGTVTSIPTP